MNKHLQTAPPPQSLHLDVAPSTNNPKPSQPGRLPTSPGNPAQPTTTHPANPFWDSVENKKAWIEFMSCSQTWSASPFSTCSQSFSTTIRSGMILLFDVAINQTASTLTNISKPQSSCFSEFVCVATEPEHLGFRAQLAHLISCFV